MSNQTNARFSALQRLLSLLFVFTLFLGLLPAGEAFAADKQYGRVNTNEVRFRRKAESTDVWSMLNSGWVVEILSTKRSGGVTYDYVVTNIPKHTDRQYWGYIDQKYITVMTSEEVTAWENAGGNAAHAVPRIDEDYAVLLHRRCDGEGRKALCVGDGRHGKKDAADFCGVHGGRHLLDRHSAAGGICQQMVHRHRCGFGGHRLRVCRTRCAHSFGVALGGLHP